MKLWMPALLGHLCSIHQATLRSSTLTIDPMVPLRAQGTSETGFVAEVVAELGRYRSQFGEDAEIDSLGEKDSNQLASGPIVDEQCIDRHPQCQMWAQRVRIGFCCETIRIDSMWPLIYTALASLA